MNILIVDDDVITGQLLARSLQRLGFQTVHCHTGAEAVDMLDQTGPALLVLDYEMPGLNGAEVCEAIRKKADTALAQSPIILLTAHAGEEHEVECLKAGADDFVSKPVNIAVLRARIETHLRLYALRQQLQEQNDELERGRRDREVDLSAARLTQQAIIPHRKPVLPGWDLAAFYQPVIQVGGDIYDWIKLPDGNLLLWIADATGHGVSAALVTMLTKLLFRHASSEASAPAAILDFVNRDFHGIFKGRAFMTAACAVAEANSGIVRMCGSGHPPILVVKRGGDILSFPSSRPPLGLKEDEVGTESECQLENGDTLLLYTDGLYSTVHENGERMSQADFLARLKPENSSAEFFLSQNVERALSLGNGEQLPDDVAAIAAMRCLNPL